MQHRHTRLAMCGMMALAACGAARAQSSVTLYGIVDAGVTWINNASGHSDTLLDTGVMQGNRLGIKGVEDLGGGMRAIFALERGFNLQNGTFAQGGLGMGRQSWVGLSSDRWGTLTMGRQYDFMYDSLGGYNTPTWSAGGYGNNPLDNDRLSGQRVNNGVKYLSPNFAGFTIGAMIGLSNLPGQFNGTGRTYSFGANYTRGPLSVGAAYTDIRGQTIDVSPLVGSATPVLLGGDFERTWGFGGTYKLLRNTTVYALYTQSIFRGLLANSGGTFRNYEAGVSYNPSAAWVLGLGYTMTTLGSKHYHQGNLTADYYLSKRTDVYAQAIYQRATGDGAYADIISLPGSLSNNQLALRIGMRHHF